MSNLQLRMVNNLSDSDWACFLGIILWRIWKNYNLFIFQGKAMSPEEVIRVSYCWAKHFTSIHNEDLEINAHQSSTHPKSGMGVNLNTNVFTPSLVFLL